MQSTTEPAGRSQLDVHTIIAVLPFVAVCILGAVITGDQAREIARNEALGRARATLRAVDTELRGHVLTLEALAMSRHVEKGDLRAMYEEMQRVMGSQPAWLNVGLQSSTGTQLFNVVMPFGSPPPPQVDQDSLERALERGTPQIGNLVVGPAIEKPAIRVRVPVVVEGKVRYVLTVPLKPELFQDILREQRLPADWDIALLDSKRRVIAAIPPQPPGTVIDDGPAEAPAHGLTRAPEGFSRAVRSDGTEAYASYVTSEASGWLISVAVPKDFVESAAWQAARPVFLGLIAALVIAALMVWISSRRSE